MIWGRKQLQVLWRGGSPDHRQRRKSESKSKSEQARERERERERASCKGLHKKNSSPKPLIGKREGADYPKFL